MNISQLLSYFSSSAFADLKTILIQSILLLILSTGLAYVFVHKARTLSNKTRLAMIFPLMALTTMLIIMIVRSSLALSLGLVGALSIIRFRTAIKDPEELAYIFLTIALGLGFGAGQPVVTSFFFLLILAVIWGQGLAEIKWGHHFTSKDSVHLELVFTKPQPLTTVTSILEAEANEIRLTRLDNNDKQTMMFLVKPKSLDSLDIWKSTFQKTDKKMQFTVLQYQPLA